jgi:hypothetical protein
MRLGIRIRRVTGISLQYSWCLSQKYTCTTRLSSLATLEVIIRSGVLKSQEKSKHGSCNCDLSQQIKSRALQYSSSKSLARFRSGILGGITHAYTRVGQVPHYLISSSLKSSAPSNFVTTNHANSIFEFMRGHVKDFPDCVPSHVRAPKSLLQGRLAPLASQK